MSSQHDRNIKDALQGRLDNIHAPEELILRTLKRITMESEGQIVPAYMTPIDSDFVMRSIEKDDRY